MPPMNWPPWALHGPHGFHRNTAGDLPGAGLSRELYFCPVTLRSLGRQAVPPEHADGETDVLGVP